MLVLRTKRKGSAISLVIIMWYSEMAPIGSYIGIIDPQKRYSLIEENVSVEADFSGLEVPKPTIVLVFSLCIVVYGSKCLAWLHI